MRRRRRAACSGAHSRGQLDNSSPDLELRIRGWDSGLVNGKLVVAFSVNHRCARGKGHSQQEKAPPTVGAQARTRTLLTLLIVVVIHRRMRTAVHALRLSLLRANWELVPLC